MLPTLKPSQNIAIIDKIAPQSLAAGTVTTGWVSAGKFTWLVGIVQLGTPGGGGLLDAKLQQAQDSSGTGVKDLLAMTQMSALGETIIQAAEYSLDINNGFNYVRLSMTTSVATSPVAGLLLGLDEAYGDDSYNDIAGVAIAG